MKFFIYFLIFVVSFIIFDWIFKKSDIPKKLFGKPQKFKYARTILIVITVLIIFSFSYVKQILNEQYGQYNYIVSIIGAFLWSIYVNFTPVIFRIK